MEYLLPMMVELAGLIHAQELLVIQIVQIVVPQLPVSSLRGTNY